MTPQSPVTMRDAMRGLRPIGWMAFATASVAGLVAIISILGVVATLFGPSPRISSPDEHTGEQAKKYASAIDGWALQLDRRSLFFVPGAPTPPPDPEPSIEPDRPPPPPSSYAGPSLIAMMNDTAFFTDGRRLAAGGPRDGDLRVVRLDPPWEATLEWKGVEFAVPLFGRDSTVAPKSYKSPEPRPEDEPARPSTRPAAPTAEPTPSGDVQPAIVPPTPANTEPTAPEPVMPEPEPAPEPPATEPEHPAPPPETPPTEPTHVGPQKDEPR